MWWGGTSRGSTWELPALGPSHFVLSQWDFSRLMAPWVSGKARPGVTTDGSVNSSIISSPHPSAGRQTQPAEWWGCRFAMAGVFPCWECFLLAFPACQTRELSALGQFGQYQPCSGEIKDPAWTIPEMEALPGKGNSGKQEAAEQGLTKVPPSSSKQFPSGILSLFTRLMSPYYSYGIVLISFIYSDLWCKSAVLPF